MFILNRAVHSYDDGCELQPEMVFEDYNEAVKAKNEWLDMVKDMLDEHGLEYEFDKDHDEIFGPEDSWDAWIETVKVNA